MSSDDKDDADDDNVTIGGDLYDFICADFGISPLNQNYTISTGTATQNYVFDNVSDSQTMRVTGNLVIEDEDGGTIDVGDFISTMKERMLILEDDFKKHEEYPALKDAYEQYKMLEKLLKDNHAKKD